MRSVRVFSFASDKLSDAELLQGIEGVVSWAVEDEMFTSEEDAEGQAQGLQVREYEIIIRAELVGGSE